MNTLDRLICRGQRVDTLEWVEGYYISKVVGAEEKHFIHSTCFTFEVIPKTVGKFTGFSANKGEGTVHVYDGDVVSWKDKVFEVKTTYGTPCFIRHQGDMFDIFEDNAWNDNVFPLVQFIWHYCDISEPYLDVEVIGNIHDNPELLEEHK